MCVCVFWTWFLIIVWNCLHFIIIIYLFDVLPYIQVISSSCVTINSFYETLTPILILFTLSNAFLFDHFGNGRQRVLVHLMPTFELSTLAIKTSAYNFISFQFCHFCKWILTQRSIWYQTQIPNEFYHTFPRGENVILSPIWRTPIIMWLFPKFSHG